MKRTVLWVGLGIVAGLMLVLGLAFARPYTYNGSLLDPPMAAPDFTLHQGNGNDFQLSGAAGKVVLVFFGYTSCPDVCPTTLADFKQVKALLKDKQDKVDYVFITVDPQRDSPEKMQQYLAGFDSSFIGLSGTEEELTPVWKAYGVYRDIPAGQDPNNYTVDHSSRVYLINPKTELRLTYTYGTPAEKIAADVRQVLKGGQ